MEPSILTKAFKIWALSLKFWPGIFLPDLFFLIGKQRRYLEISASQKEAHPMYTKGTKGQKKQLNKIACMYLFAMMAIYQIQHCDSFHSHYIPRPFPLQSPSIFDLTTPHRRFLDYTLSICTKINIREPCSKSSFIFFSIPLAFHPTWPYDA